MTRSMVVWLACSLLGCASAPAGGPPDTPSGSDEARHGAALATIVVDNATDASLTIAFRSATPPLQEVIIGRVAARARTQVAPVPAAEPIVLVARKDDGTEFTLAPRSLQIDAEWIWEIPHDATFTTRAR